MDGKISLSPAEWKIMQKLWESSRTITRLTQDLKEETGWSKSTVISFLDRLENKGAVRYESGQKARLYYPALTREDMAVQETESFLSRVYGGSLGLMVNTLAGQDALSKQDIAELHDMLDSLMEKEG